MEIGVFRSIQPIGIVSPFNTNEIPKKKFGVNVQKEECFKWTEAADIFHLSSIKLSTTQEVKEVKKS